LQREKACLQEKDSIAVRTTLHAYLSNYDLVQLLIVSCCSDPELWYFINK